MRTGEQCLRVAEVEQINPWVRCFRLVPGEGEKLAPFIAGQYINLFYKIGASITSRPYSIASSPKDAEEGFYELYIRGDGPFTSGWLFENIKVGSKLRASLPEGDFHYVAGEDHRRVIGISGGMSVTPLRAMARAVVDGSLDIDLTLFCGWDTAEEVLYYEEFQSYARICPRFRVVFAVADGRLPGGEKELVTMDMVRRYVDSADATFFLCGPAAMYSVISRGLDDLGIPQSCRHQELPGEANLAALLEERPQTVLGQYTLAVHTGGSVRHLPMEARETVLVALERGGIAAGSRCRSGHCGFCRTRLKAGKVFVPSRWQTEIAGEERGYIHPCCSFPLSDLTIELAEK